MLGVATLVSPYALLLS